jgi:predicted DCC family thiol-disulfide oxidoreductase YuxK
MNPQKIILFDEVCPLCCLYTGAFERCGWLDAGGRMAFPAGLRQWRAQVDQERARHEIPLIDSAGGPTLYGLDALVFLIGQRHPRLASIADLPWIRKPLGVLYRFISYNRRVIAGSTGCLTPEEGAPAFHLGWRMAWLTVAAGLTALGFLVLAGTAALAVTWMAGLWMMAAAGFGTFFVRTWDGLGRWAGHAVLGTLLWILVSLLPVGPIVWLASAIALILLTVDARHRCGGKFALT